MEAKGLEVKGINHSGLKSLGTIGNLICRYDYRFGLTTKLDGGSNTDILILSDLGPNGLDVIGQELPGNRCPHLVSDGIICNGGNTDLRYPGGNLDMFKALHDGTPHFVYFIARINNSGNVSQVINAFSTNNTGTPGAAFSPDVFGSNNRVSQGFQNNAGGVAGQHITANGTLTEDANFRLYTFTFYANSGTNNSRITIEATSYFMTRSLSLGTNNPNRFLLFNMPNATVDIVRWKAFGAYNLAGKSVAQIDAFITDFITVLKQDPEYSGLTTF